MNRQEMTGAAGSGRAGVPPAAESHLGALWGSACGCSAHGGSGGTGLSRRRFGLGALALAGGGVLGGCAPGESEAAPGDRVSAPGKLPECKRSVFSKVGGSSIEQQAEQQYLALLQDAKSQGALVPSADPRTQRLQSIARRIIPKAPECNAKAAQWKWSVALIDSKTINAFCMPGGKIAFFTGIIDRLQLSDEEIAVVMGHEISHAVLEHAQEQMGKGTATSVGLRVISAILGLGQLGDMAAQAGASLLSLRYGRTDESEADALGLVMSSQAAFDPRAGVTLWEKMTSVSKGAPPSFLSTHPSGPDRIRQMQALLPRTMPLYQAAAR